MAKTGRKNRVRQYGKEKQICDILRFTGLFVRVSGGAERKLKKRGGIFKWPCKKVEKTLRGRENPYMYAWSHARKKIALEGVAGAMRAISILALIHTLSFLNFG